MTCKLNFANFNFAVRPQPRKPRKFVDRENFPSYGKYLYMNKNYYNIVSHFYWLTQLWRNWKAEGCLYMWWFIALNRLILYHYKSKHTERLVSQNRSIGKGCQLTTFDFVRFHWYKSDKPFLACVPVSLVQTIPGLLACKPLDRYGQTPWAIRFRLHPICSTQDNNGYTYSIIVLCITGKIVQSVVYL